MSRPPSCYGKPSNAQQRIERACHICAFVFQCGNAVKANQTNVDDEQAGGDHYKRMEIQPWAVIDTWALAERIGFYRGNLLKYTMRMHDKDAPKDNIEKAAHYARKLSEVLDEAERLK